MREKWKVSWQVHAGKLDVKFANRLIHWRALRPTADQALRGPQLWGPGIALLFVTFAFMRELALWCLQCCTHGAWCRTCPSGLATSEASQTMAWMSRPCPTSMNHITTGPPCNGRPTRWKSMGWRASCMRPMCPWCDRACATYSWRAIIWSPWCSRSTIACFTVTTVASFEDAWLRTTARERQKETEKDEKYVRITLWLHTRDHLGSMSGCPLRATTHTRQWASAGRRCQWQHPTFANARFMSAGPWDQYAGASAGHTQGPHLGEYPYTRLAEGQVLGPTTHPQIHGIVQGGHWTVHGRVLWVCWWRSWSPGVPDQ